MAMKMDCEKYRSELEDLALGEQLEQYADSGRAASLHFQQCKECAGEIESMRATMRLMDAWAAPELSPYFDTRMQQALRTAASQPPAGLWSGLLQRWSMRAHGILKPAMAAVAAVAVIVGGAMYTGVGFWQQPNAPVQESATVHDLQSLDHNAQTLEDLQALDQADQPQDSGSVSQ